MRAGIENSPLCLNREVRQGQEKARRKVQEKRPFSGLSQRVIIVWFEMGMGIPYCKVRRGARPRPEKRERERERERALISVSWQGPRRGRWACERSPPTHLWWIFPPGFSDNETPCVIGPTWALIDKMVCYVDLTNKE